MTEVGMLLRAVRTQGMMLRPLERRINTCKTPELRESMCAMYNREQRILDAKMKEVQPFLDKMTDELRVFCTMDYVHGFSIPDVSDMLERSERQVARYKAKVEKGR